MTLPDAPIDRENLDISIRTYEDEGTSLPNFIEFDHETLTYSIFPRAPTDKVGKYLLWIDLSDSFGEIQRFPLIVQVQKPISKSEGLAILVPVKVERQNARIIFKEVGRDGSCVVRVVSG